MISKQVLDGEVVHVQYLKEDYTPTEKGKHSMVRITFSNGDVRLGVVPVKKEDLPK